jgi:hypothetical protein
MKPAAWVNSKPLGPEELRGKVSLVHFFCFGEGLSEITMSHLSYMWSKMRDKGLVVLGVHAPRLESEKGAEFVRAEAERRGITFPIAVDDEFQVWNAFRNQFFGQSHFVDAQGMIRHTRSGQGIEEEVEMAVVHLLNEAGMEVDLGPEINGACFEGEWYVGDGYVELQGASGSIEMRYVSSSLDLILSSPVESKCEITLDDLPIPEGCAGGDVLLEEGRSYLLIGEERRHRVVREERSSMREVQVHVHGKGLRLIGFCVDE